MPAQQDDLRSQPLRRSIGERERERAADALRQIARDVEPEPDPRDGRAKNVSGAIAAHDGEARASRDRFMGLSATDTKAVLDFLGSLRTEDRGFIALRFSGDIRRNRRDRFVR